MEYTVACNWDPELLDRIDYPEVTSVFGGLPDTVLSGGRSSISINNMSEDDIRSYIKKVHDKGWKFDYNINTTCTSNMELTSEGHKEIMKYLDWVVGLGVDSITVSIPLLVEIIKKHYPQVKIKISTYQKINSVSMAKRFEDLGADALMLSEHVNRDFSLIRAIKKSVQCKLVLLANVGCVYGCANMFTHANSIAHSGARGERDTVFTETYQTYCVARRLDSTAELIKMRWIRPEDVSYYEDAGVDMLKIIDRHSSTDALAERVKAYHERSYEGNFLDFPGQMVNRRKSRMINLERIFADRSNEEISRIRKFLNAFSVSIPDLFYMDNKKFPKDFIEGFEKRNCSLLSCEQCGYCQKIADMCVTTLDDNKVKALTEKLKDVREQVKDGSILY